MGRPDCTQYCCDYTIYVYFLSTNVDQPSTLCFNISDTIAEKAKLFIEFC